MGCKRIPRDEKVAAIVERLAGIGVPEKTLAQVIGMSVTTMQKLYANELANGRAKGDSKLMDTAFHLAVEKRNVTMLIFLLKTRLGMKENYGVELSGPDGGPVAQSQEIVVRFVNPEDGHGD